MSTIGYAIVDTTSGEILERLPMLGADHRAKVVHPDGQATWEMPGWADDDRAIVPVDRSDIELGLFEASVEQPAVFDGEKVVIATSAVPLAESVVSARVKQTARNIILRRYPDWKQQNMTARGVEIVFKLASGVGLTQSEQDEADLLQAAWDWIKAVRSHSDALETAYRDGEAISLVNGWPE